MDWILHVEVPAAAATWNVRLRTRSDAHQLGVVGRLQGFVQDVVKELSQDASLVNVDTSCCGFQVFRQKALAYQEEWESKVQAAAETRSKIEKAVARMEDMHAAYFTELQQLQEQLHWQDSIGKEEHVHQQMHPMHLGPTKLTNDGSTQQLLNDKPRLVKHVRDAANCNLQEYSKSMQHQLQIVKAHLSANNELMKCWQETKAHFAQERTQQEPTDPSLEDQSFSCMHTCEKQAALAIAEGMTVQEPVMGQEAATISDEANLASHEHQWCFSSERTKTEANRDTDDKTYTCGADADVCGKKDAVSQDPHSSNNNLSGTSLPSMSTGIAASCVLPTDSMIGSTDDDDAEKSINKSMKEISSVPVSTTACAGAAEFSEKTPAVFQSGSTSIEHTLLDDAQNSTSQQSPAEATRRYRRRSNSVLLTCPNPGVILPARTVTQHEIIDGGNNLHEKVAAPPCQPRFKPKKWRRPRPMMTSLLARSHGLDSPDEDIHEHVNSTDVGSAIEGKHTDDKDTKWLPQAEGSENSGVLGSRLLSTGVATDIGSKIDNFKGLHDKDMKPSTCTADDILGRAGSASHQPEPTVLKNAQSLTKRSGSMRPLFSNTGAQGVEATSVRSNGRRRGSISSGPSGILQGWRRTDSITLPSLQTIGQTIFSGQCDQ